MVLAICALLPVAGGCGSSSNVSVAPTSIERCGVTVAGTASPVPASGGNGTLTVNAQRECSWSAKAESPWISLSAGAGQGPATITYSVQANPNAATRRAGVTVDDQRVEIAQDPAPCRYGVSPSSAELPAVGGSAAVTVTAPGGCPWTAQTAAPWLSGSPGSGQGSGGINFTAAPNPAGARDAAVNIGGVTISFHQAATSTAPPPPPVEGGCTITLRPGSYNAGAESDDVKISVRTARACTWSSSSPVPWVSIKDGRNGSGDGEVKLRIEDNEGAARSTTLVVADQAFSVTQGAKKKK